MQHVVYAYLYPDIRVQCCMHRCETKVRHILRQWSVPERRRRPATRQARGYLRKDAGSNRENVPCRPTGTSPTTSRGVRRRGSRLFSAGQKMVRGNVGLATSIKSRYVYTFAPQSVFRLPTSLPPMVYRETALVVQTRPFTSPTACRCVHTLLFGHARGPAARSTATKARSGPVRCLRPRSWAARAGTNSRSPAGSPRDGRRRASRRGTIQAFRRCDARLHAVVDPVASTPTWGKIRVACMQSLAIDTTRGT